MTAAEAEAAGRPIVAVYQGQSYLLPGDVEDWPLPLVAASLVVKPGDVAVEIDYTALRVALSCLLGDQWPRFKTEHPKRKHLVPASHVFAAAAGFAESRPLQIGPPPTVGGGNVKPYVRPPVDEFFAQLGKTFGTLVRVLALIEMCPDKVESDLRRFWGLRYSDRFRVDDTGQRCLTLREIGVCLANLPAESALARAMGHHAPTELLLMDLYERMAGHAHPSRPLTAEQLAERKEAVSKADAESKAREDYRRRHGLPPRGNRTNNRSTSSLLETARANAQQRKASAHAQTQAARHRAAT